MKINLPVFKDEDAKDMVTYQSWRWDLTVYWHAGCRDHTLLPYAIQSLQGYPGELAWSSSTDIMLDDMLTILDEHYNNVKVLDHTKPGAIPVKGGRQKRLFQIGASTSQDISKF